MKIELNKIFIVHKGKRKMRWKVIKHPYFDSLTLVRDYASMTNELKKSDINHICGSVTLDNAYEVAYGLT